MRPVVAAADSVGFIQVVVGILGGSGIVGAVVTLLKLRPDIDTLTVSRAKGAAETLEIANKQLVIDREYWRSRAMEAEKELERVRRQLERYRRKATHDPPE